MNNLSEISNKFIGQLESKIQGMISDAGVVLNINSLEEEGAFYISFSSKVDEQLFNCGAPLIPTRDMYQKLVALINELYPEVHHINYRLDTSTLTIFLFSSEEVEEFHQQQNEIRLIKQGFVEVEQSKVVSLLKAFARKVKAVKSSSTLHFTLPSNKENGGYEFELKCHYTIAGNTQFEYMNQFFYDANELADKHFHRKASWIQGETYRDIME